jgi:hypothetical protein
MTEQQQSRDVKIQRMTYQQRAPLMPMTTPANAELTPTPSQVIVFYNDDFLP